MAPVTIPPTLARLAVDIDSVVPYPANPRQGDIGAIAQSLEANGQFRPLVVNKRTMQVLAGNHTLAAARSLGWKKVAVTFVDVDEDTALRIVLADNRTNDLASYDDSQLSALLVELAGTPLGLDGSGYDGDDLDLLLKDLSGKARIGQKFNEVDEDNIGIQFRCPSCGYGWSGSAT